MGIQDTVKNRKFKAKFSVETNFWNWTANSSTHFGKQNLAWTRKFKISGEKFPLKYGSTHHDEYLTGGSKTFRKNQKSSKLHWWKNTLAMIMSDDVVYRNLKVYKTLVARLLKKIRFEKNKHNSKESVYFKDSGRRNSFPTYFVISY